MKRILIIIIFLFCHSASAQNRDVFDELTELMNSDDFRVAVACQNEDFAMASDDFRAVCVDSNPDERSPVTAILAKLEQIRVMLARIERRVDNNERSVNLNASELRDLRTSVNAILRANTSPRVTIPDADLLFQNSPPTQRNTRSKPKPSEFGWR